MVAQSPEAQRISLSYPNADAVYLMGAFNNWSTSRTPMYRVGEDLWEATLPREWADCPLHLFVWERGRRCARIVSLASASARYAESSPAPRSLALRR